MGSKLGNFSGTPHFSLSSTNMMYKLIFCLSVAAALPLEDTVEVQEARSNFLAAFAAAEAGDHQALAPVNNDLQAPQIAAAYLADTEDVMNAKEDFEAVFKNVEAGGLMDLQAPAPEAPVVKAEVLKVPVVYSHHIPYYNLYHHNLVQPTTALTYNALHPLPFTGLHPVNYAATFPYTYPVLAPVKAEA